MVERLSGITSVLSAPARRRLTLALVGSVLVSLTETLGMLLIVPLMLLITGSPVDEGSLGRLNSALGSPDRDTFAVYLAALVVSAFLLKAISTVAFRWWMLGTMARESVHTSTEILRHYVRMPYVQHLQRGPANLLRTMGDACTTFYTAVVGGGISVVTESIGIVGIVVAMMLTAPIPTLVLLVYFAGAATVYRRISKPMMTRIGAEMTELSVRTFESAYTVLSGIKAFKLRGNAAYFVAEYEGYRGRTARTERQSTMLTELPKYILEVLFIIGVGVTTVAVFSTDQASGRSLGVLALFVAAGFRVLPGMTRLLGALNGITIGIPFAQLVVEETAAARELAAETPATTATPEPLPLAGGIRLDSLTFRYPGAADDVIRGIDLEIPTGSSVALVGGSGAGKSTLVDLMLGLHVPSSGQISAGGVNVAAHMDRWQANLAMVPQDVYLLDRSLRENIALGVAPELIDEDRIASAVRDAQLTDLVDQLPEGLNTSVGDRGSRLSGGQRQRIGIARALYTNPSLLALDEATSSLDNITERRIADTIERLGGQMTVVIVAHRLSTVRHCDQIVHMADGEVVASGSFAEVQRKSPEFARLVALGRLDLDESLGEDDAAGLPRVRGGLA